jgi:hypothetical protein
MRAQTTPHCTHLRGRVKGIAGVNGGNHDRINTVNRAARELDDSSMFRPAKTIDGVILFVFRSAPASNQASRTPADEIMFL